MLAKVIGVGVETADMLVHEILPRKLRDRRAVARYAGPTGAPDESGKRRREKGLSRTSRAMRDDPVGVALSPLPERRALAQRFQARTSDGRSATRKTMIVALARKLLIALWRLVTTGDVPEGVVLRPA
ncbi:transposase [Ensifer sp. P24N7]|uniref:transposase n=1 Tax=Sinorhizobium sp. P24N7 TaxID=3348358 RepID=UPI0035F32285